jgi:predicted nucleotidyltransferase
MAFDLAAAAQTYVSRRNERRADLAERLDAMRQSAEAMIAHIRDVYQPVRIYQWGSLLNEHHFSELSDIDIAVEGVIDLHMWLRLEKELLDMAPYPLDLVRWENLWPEH